MPEPDDELDELDAIGLLADPLRRRLYAYVARQDAPVSRDDAAVAVDVPRHTAKFHLDKMVEAGLLETEFRRLSGRTGPGAGRPSKLYRRSSRQVMFSLPERRYELAGQVLAAAIDRSMAEGRAVADVLPEVARDLGRSLVDVAPDTDDSLVAASTVLARNGYEPVVAETEVSLCNCPFDRLAAEHTALVCGLNRDLVAGVIDALGADDLEARLAPQEGFCCVKVVR